jgi:ABC-type glycerol-3-phosphate transport system permease component
LQVFWRPARALIGPSSAATLLTSAPLLVAFLLFQRQFVQSFGARV